MAIVMVEAKVFVFMPQKLGPDVREGKRRQFNYIGNWVTFLDFDIGDRMTHDS